MSFITIIRAVQEKVISSSTLVSLYILHILWSTGALVYLHLSISRLVRANLCYLHLTAETYLGSKLSLIILKCLSLWELSVFPWSFSMRNIFLNLVWRALLHFVREAFSPLNWGNRCAIRCLIEDVQYIDGEARWIPSRYAAYVEDDVGGNGSNCNNYTQDIKRARLDFKYCVPMSWIGLGLQSLGLPHGSQTFPKHCVTINLWARPWNKHIQPMQVYDGSKVQIIVVSENEE